ncbi:MAG: hypothetical protein ACRDUX_24990 [Mycobacterium sp.]
MTRTNFIKTVLPAVAVAGGLTAAVLGLGAAAPASAEPPLPVIESWADDYIRFERRPIWQQALRSEIRSRCGRHVPSTGQLVHATFFGPKLPNADVEYLALYNIDSFNIAGRNGIRFEHCAAADVRVA